MYKNKGLIFLVFILMLFLGCTQKKNTVAFETKGNPQELILGDSIFIETSGCKYLSFEDSLKNYSSNSKLLVAKYEVNNFANESRTLIRSLNLPDTVISINSDVYLNIPVRSVNDQFDVNELKLGKLNKEWNESKATWTTATDTTWENAGGDFTEINDFEMTHNNDTISVKIPQDLIIEWVDDVDNNFGLIIYTEQENFIAEFYSSEDIFFPRLVFDYTDEDNEEVSFDKIISADTFISITDDQYEIFQNQIIFSNIQPIRSYINFKLEKSYFEGITDSLEFKRITINKAELCFIRKTDNEYFDEGTITIKPYLVIADTIDINDTTKPMISDNDYESYYTIASKDSLHSATTKEFKIDISKLVQGIISDDIVNKGILLRSVYESMDLKHLEFETVTPELRIIYTVPVLEN